MLLLGVVMVVKGGADGNTLEVFNPGTTSISTAFDGVLLAILLFVGFEAAASIGEESQDPTRAIPRAVLGTVAASAIFFVFMAYAISIGLGRTAVEDGAWTDPAVLDKLATHYVGSWLATIVDLVVILDAFGLALAICVTIGRGYFALGRDGLLPKVFAKTSRHDTPWVGNLMVAVGGIGLIILAQIAARPQFTEHSGRAHPDLPATTSSRRSSLAATSARSWSRSSTSCSPWSRSGSSGRRAARASGGSSSCSSSPIATPLLGFKGALWPDPHNSSNYNWVALYWSIGDPAGRGGLAGDLSDAAPEPGADGGPARCRGPRQRDAVEDPCATRERSHSSTSTHPSDGAHGIRLEGPSAGPSMTAPVASSNSAPWQLQTSTPSTSSPSSESGQPVCVHSSASACHAPDARTRTTL